MQKPLYSIGIDLGTTNCTLSYTSISSPEVIEQFSIAQVVEPSVVKQELSLPSFVYLPLEEELKETTQILKESSAKKFCIGKYARDRGAELPNRLIASAKSWLCHSHIDRREKILPLEFENKSLQLSPFEACAEFLAHLKAAWNAQQPNALFNEQLILVTVPASFDPSARQLVEEAAQKADYPSIILLEEPQAAFYAWIYSHAEQWRQELKVGDLLLVVDIGGGTTDFSLIKVEERNGDLELSRQAVGSHLLLGGDNIDLALAYFVRQKFEEQGHSIDHWQLQSLIHQCRQAKELLLSESSAESVDITILGRGSRLMGNALKIEITREEITPFILSGFFPIVETEEQSPTERHSGLQQIGLPYVKDPRVTCQLAKFLSLSGENDNARSKEFVLPTAVLFNGGTLKSFKLREQLMQQLNYWAKKAGLPPVKELQGADYDYSVSRGACYYGLARQGKAVRIRAGTSRSYFIGIEEAAPAVPGINPALKAICIAPFGLEEGQECTLDNQEFALALGELATFRFFSHQAPELLNGEPLQVGEVIRNWKQELTELHPIETVLEKKEQDGKTIRVKLHSKVTELGVLELWCVAEDGRRWKLEFDTRIAK